ncbi:uncharacterized protein WCC33_006454 [Rhinophrynus dorsalis]
MPPAGKIRTSVERTSMMNTFQWKPLTDYRHQDTEITKYSGTLKSTVGFLEDELRRGYQKEAVTLNAAMENLTRIYLTRFQALEKELNKTKWELEEAEKQQWEAQKTQSELLQQNWQLLKTLQQLRKSMEKDELRKHRRARTPPEITNWKLVQFPGRHHNF